MLHNVFLKRFKKKINSRLLIIFLIRFFYREKKRLIIYQTKILAKN